MRILLTLVCLALTTCMVSAKQPVVIPLWGKDGHAVVASIAMNYLGVNATESCQTLLPDVNGDLSQIASWADSVDHTAAYKWSAVLHYINTPDWLCNYDRARDCHDEKNVPNNCVDMAIQNYTQRLLDISISLDQKTEALKFLVHFVGDIHQPLHVGFTTDQGGNTESGTFIKQTKVKLHAIWDTAIIQKRINDDFQGKEADYVTSLITRLGPGGDFNNNIPAWQSCDANGGDDHNMSACSIGWASESISYACTNSEVAADGVTHIDKNFNLQLDYYTRNLPIVEQRLVQGGIRLANVINHIWPSSTFHHQPQMAIA